MEREKEMKELLRMKDSMIQGKINDIEDMDKSITEKDQQLEKLDIKLQGRERTFTMQQKTQNEKIAQLNDIIQSEQETRDLWRERYEAALKAQQIESAQLLQAKNEYNDLKIRETSTKNKLA